MVYNVIHQVLGPRGIRYCVAQGEADGQIAALQKHGDVDAAASVDGDIIIHGVTEFYTKINYQTGEALRYQSQCLTTHPRLKIKMMLLRQCVLHWHCKKPHSDN